MEARSPSTTDAERRFSVLSPNLRVAFTIHGLLRHVYIFLIKKINLHSFSAWLGLAFPESIFCLVDRTNQMCLPLPPLLYTGGERVFFNQEMSSSAQEKRTRTNEAAEDRGREGLISVLEARERLVYIRTREKEVHRQTKFHLCHSFSMAHSHFTPSLLKSRSSLLLYYT